jgi:hypothetical protein
MNADLAGAGRSIDVIDSDKALVESPGASLTFELLR